MWVTTSPEWYMGDTAEAPSRGLWVDGGENNKERRCLLRAEGCVDGWMDEVVW